MLKKIFKTIFIMSICIGISLPTNAAVSVSDGSAFVTKAEFAADLNNLSNRMAQLENSLDAKIDSLVSSYLTRNGIWNGARQSIVGQVKYLPNNIFNVSLPDTFTTNRLIDFEFTASKTGMLFCDLKSMYTVYQSRSQLPRFYSWVGCWTGNWAVGMCTINILKFLVYNKLTNVVLSTSELSRGDGIDGTGSIGYCALPLSDDVEIIMQMFVEKDKEYVIALDWITAFFDKGRAAPADATYSLGNIWYDDSGQLIEKNWNVKVVDLSIY